MSKKDFKRAQPYADAAAQTWAEWAMVCATNCHEGIGHWEQAETWAQRVSERYGPRATSFWFFWCKRTGKGNVQAAQRLLAVQIEGMAPDRNLDDHLTRAGYYAMVGEPCRGLTTGYRVR